MENSAATAIYVLVIATFQAMYPLVMKVIRLLSSLFVALGLILAFLYSSLSFRLRRLLAPA